MTWSEWKQKGSKHYIKEGVQPVDLYKDLDRVALHNWAIFEITQHAFRNISPSEKIISDMNKIIHYAEMIIINHKEKNDA
jgi:hypothetical protein